MGLFSFETIDKNQPQRTDANAGIGAATGDIAVPREFSSDKVLTGENRKGSWLAGTPYSGSPIAVEKTSIETADILPANSGS
jgi:hypothetical protein